MKQCPTCGLQLWLENDGLWHCSNCNTAVSLKKGDEIFRVCGNCNPIKKLQFSHKGKVGFIFECPTCNFTQQLA